MKRPRRSAVIGRKKDWTFKTTDKTIVRVGRKNGGWPDVKSGATMQVTFHSQGNERIADRIVITGTGF
jgi:hypothetical protein